MAHHPRHHYRLAASLASSGLDVRMLSQPDPQPGHRDAVPVDYLPRRRTRLGRMASGPLTVIRALRRRPDAIHVVTLELLPWAVLAKRFTRTRMLYDSNEEYHDDMLHKEWLPPAVRVPAARIVARLEPWLGARLDAVTTAVAPTAERFRAAGARVVLCRNLPSRDILPPAPRSGPFRYDVLVGGTVPSDLMPDLVETAAALRARGHDARWLVVIRDCRPNERALLERLLAERGLRGRFEILYDQPFTEMPRFLAAARVGFILFKGRAVPQRIFEYMAWGIPFVIPDLPLAADLVRESGVGLVTSPEPEASADALALLLSDGALSTEMAARGPELVESELTWDRESAALVELYRSLLGSRFPATPSTSRGVGSPVQARPQEVLDERAG
jgi:glycosyltransferase involved in cell wall biosynthesis